MSDDFEKLKNIGAQKIHETTHITRAHVQAILHESFEDMNSVQLLGFISILEREYSMDLSELRGKVKEFFKNNNSLMQSSQSVKIFKSSPKKRNLTFVYIVIGAAIVAFTAFLTIGSSKNQVSRIDDSAIESAKNIAAIEDDKTNAFVVKEIKQEEPIIEEAVKQEEIKQEEVPKQEETIIEKESKQVELKDRESQSQESSFKIVPSRNVWIGYIDLSNYKKYQKTFSDELVLDSKKDWLLAFGHGRISIEVNGVVTEFKNPKNIRFSYINSELKEIDFEEFKSLNKGSGW